MEMVFINGMMVNDMLELGKIIKCTVKEYLGFQMVENIKDNILKIKNKDMDNLLFQIQKNI